MYLGQMKQILYLSIICMCLVGTSLVQTYSGNYYAKQNKTYDIPSLLEQMSIANIKFSDFDTM